MDPIWIGKIIFKADGRYGVKCTNNFGPDAMIKTPLPLPMGQRVHYSEIRD